MARGKATVKKLDQVTFQQGSLLSLPVADGSFDLVVGDASFFSPSQIAQALAELRRVAALGAPMALKMMTRGSFDEFYSVYWEALYNLELLEYSTQLETMILGQMTVSEAEDLAAAAQWKKMRSVTQKERFDFAEAKLFLESPLIETYFLDAWLSILPDEATRSRVRQEIGKLIDARDTSMDFDVSIKATLILGTR